MSSFVGAIAVADLVKTTLGPKGMDKILQSVRSSDGISNSAYHVFSQKCTSVAVRQFQAKDISYYNSSKLSTPSQPSVLYFFSVRSISYSNILSVFSYSYSGIYICP